ncbi:EamA family transporter RarD [Ammonicoccus fulvus]|uniref:EamA family transporter RarD n=1 Tax=Ammonicoccus fulvus TaxID=3138240 RepID=A0ABZ3FU39_9ACTN
MTPDRRAHKLGVFAALGAYFLWGIVPMFWPLLDRAGAVEILAHRIAWSTVFGAVLVAVFARKRWRAQITGRGTIMRLLLASVVIAVNWGVYIWAVNNGRVTESALGYYINPLLAILVGVFVFSEKLSPVQWGAIGLAAVAVVVITIEYGQPPWVALVLAVSFTIYGVIKKGVKVEPIVSLTVESALMFLPAVGFMIWLASRNQSTFLEIGIGHDLLLVASGIVTAIPLLLFAFAAQRIPLSLLGLTQYLAPTMQFLLGVFYFKEAMSSGRWIGFALVWLALMIISTQAVITARRKRRAERTAAAAEVPVEEPR